MPIREFVPYLSVTGAKEAVAFYSRVFETEPALLLNMPDGRVMHCEFRFGSARFFLSEELPEHGGTLSPMSLGATTVAIHLYVDDCDAVVANMKSNGAEVVREQGQFVSMVKRGQRNVTIATVEKLAKALKFRMADLMPDAEDGSAASPCRISAASDDDSHRVEMEILSTLCGEFESGVELRLGNLDVIGSQTLVRITTGSDDAGYQLVLLN